MSQQDAEVTAVKVGMFVSNLKQLSDRIVIESHQATQNMNRTAQGLAVSAESAGRQAIERLQKTAADVVVTGAGAAIGDIEKRLMACATKVEIATSPLAQRQGILNSMHTASAWKAFIASAFGSLAVVAVAIYVVWHAHKDLQQVQWVEQINAAETAGKLAPCPEGGICVFVNKKWVRVDK